MILHRPRTELGAWLAQSGKRIFRLRIVLLLIAPLLALALAATMLPRGFSQAATSLPVEWVPGDMQNIQDLSGCHARQNATVKASTPALAARIRDQMEQVKEKDLVEHGLKLLSIWKTDVTGATVSLEIDTWYTGECPFQSSSALQSGKGTTIQLAGFHNAAMQRATLLKWVKTAFAAVATGVVYVTLLTVIFGVMAAVAPEVSAISIGILGGCVAGAAANVIGSALFTGNWKDSVVRGALGCTWGGVLGPLGPTAAEMFGDVVEELLAAGTPSWMGPGAAAAATEAAVDIQPISEVVSTTAAEILRAAR